jgi:hypothetical protein
MDMYFAVDKLASDFHEQLTDAFQRAQPGADSLRFYALVDTAFHHVQGHRPDREQKALWTSIYDGTGNAALVDASPCLLPLPDEPRSLRGQLFRLLKKNSGYPMMSFIASHLSTIALAAAFKPFIEAGCDDDQSFLLRFGDTRVLPAVDEVLRKEQVAGWRHGVAYWWVPDRRGNLMCLPEYADSTPSARLPTTPLLVSQAAFALLADAGDADAILDAIFDQNPGLLLAQRPSDAYGLVQRLRPKLKEFGIADFRDVVMFYTTALATSEHFHKQADFHAVLEAGAWKPGRLGDAFAAIEDASWAAIQATDEGKTI